MTAPRATARLQLHADFTFDAARRLVPYWAALGVSHLYLSPILKARPGSRHGYDVIDPTTVNPELGGEAGLRALVQALRSHAMGVIVDIVPNHMAVGADNPWWLDVLEWGRTGRYASHFDIDWDVPARELHGRVLTPFLGRPYGEALADGEIRLAFDDALGAFAVTYFGHRLPVAAQLYAPLLLEAGEPLAGLAPRLRAAVRGSLRAREAAFAEARAGLARGVRESAPMRRAMDQRLESLSPDAPGGAQRLHKLLERQHWRLAWWRTAADEINWRRFFDIGELAALRIERPDVFRDAHVTLLRLYAEGLVDGFRIDHVDGLANPAAYCRQLRRALAAAGPARPGHRPWLIVEKILAPGEPLEASWRVDGTSGYAFMNDAGALLHDAAGEPPLTALWSSFTGRTATFADEEREARRDILEAGLAADFNACVHALHSVARSQLQTRDWSVAAVRRVLREFLVHMPIYRTYADESGRSPQDAAVMAGVVAQARRTCRRAERPLVDLLDRWLGGEAPRSVRPVAARRLRERAIARFQQLTSPLSAKSVEDTAFYRFGRLLSRNEVGADPAQFAMSVGQFHAACAARRTRYPATMLATATHDHKRGEDARARLAVLSERPDAWAQAVRGWATLNAPHKRRVDGQAAPDAVDEYFLYQSIAGAWPLDLRADDAAGLAAFHERMAGWQRKALREAKRHTSWHDPVEACEAGALDFLREILLGAGAGAFVPQMRRFVEAIAPCGALNGLAQTLLRCTAPGVPDLYQGSEFWDFSLVDPDNRRAVDYGARVAALQAAGPVDALLEHWRDGRIKQRIVRAALGVRARHPETFAQGRYVPLAVEGSGAGSVVAYARVGAAASVIAIAPLRAARLVGDGARPQVPADRWGDTRVTLGDELRGLAWRDALCDEALVPDGDALLLRRVLARTPVALLAGAPR